jgi:hydrogenase maturation protease
MVKGTIVLGMGNSILGDDGAGIYVVNELEKRIGRYDGIDFECVSWGGFRIIDVLHNYKDAIIIDAINTRKKPVGFIHVADNNKFIKSVRMVSFHDINFTEAIDFAKKLNILMPESITVYGIEVRNTEAFKEGLSPVVQAAAEKCIIMISDKIQLMNNNLIINEFHKYE